MKRLFPAMTVIHEGSEIYHVRQGLEALAAGKSTENAALYRFYAGQPEYAGELSMIDKGRSVKHVEEHIAPQTAQKLFAQPPLTSVTHLEQFAACQMAHFLKYGLHLKERQEYQLRSLDMGNLYHDAFDTIFRRIGQEGLDIRTLQEEQKEALVEEGICHALENFSSDIFDSSSKNDYTRTRMKEILRLNLDAVFEQLMAGAYSVEKTELAFGMKGSEQHPPMKLGNSAFSLMGKIDRLDEAKGADGSSYLRVVDYKTGNTSFDFTKVMNGLQLQLMLYLSSALGMKPDTKAAGAFYYHIDEPVVELSAKEIAALPENEKEALVHERQLQQLRMNGILNREDESVSLFETNLPNYQTSRVLTGLKMKKDGGLAKSDALIPEQYMKMLMDEAKEQTVRLGDEMLTGAIDTNPYLYEKKKPCEYCAFRQVCGFNIGFSGYHYRRIQKQKMIEVFGNREAQNQEE
jgi:ATP-dependent helicase/nuclease subunit B